MKYLYLLSKFRGELTGIAIILIMLFHCGVLNIGCIGVEIFVLLSGLGSYYSISKESEPKKFYRKRLLRILPTYILFGVPIIIFYDYEYGFVRVLAECSTLYVLVGGRFYWFIMLIVLCYLIAPLYFRIQTRYKYTIVVSIVATIIAYFISLRFPEQSIWLQRFPSFFLGMDIGKFIQNDEKSENISKVSWLYILKGGILISLLICVEPMLSDQRIRAIYFFVVPIITISICLFLQIANISPLSDCLKFVGNITLELYIVHELVCLPLVKHLTSVNGFVIPGSILIAIAMSYCMSKISSVLTAKIGI